jgi:transposase
VAKTYRPYEPRQSFLLPPCPLDWLPEGHLALFLLDVVEQLDLSALFRYYEREGRGYPPHQPRMMVALLLYAYCLGVPSSRKIEKRTYEDIAFRVLAGNTHPDHSCISEFRRIHLVALAALFVQVLKLCQAAGLVKLGHVALDGTKVKANASKHKAMSYDRMKEKEEALCRKVQEMLEAAEAVDQQEDAEHGRGRRGDELPEELRRAETRRARIEQLRQQLEAEAREQKRAQEQAAQAPPPAEDQAPGATELPTHQIPRTKQGEPTDQAQRNFTDGDSRIMKTGDGFVQGYNCQAVVDGEHQIIVGEAVTNQPPDVEHLVPMVEQVVDNCGEAPQKLSADAGYFSEDNVVGAHERGVEPYIAAGRNKHEEPAPPVRGRPPKGLTLKEGMARKLATKKGRAVYSRRKVVVEPVFGQIKGRGFRQFLLRGLAKVRGEWALITLTHNLLKLHGAMAAA